MASLTFLIEDFTVVLKLRFRSLLFSFCLARFSADRWVAKVYPPFFPLTLPSPQGGEGRREVIDLFNILL